MLYRRFRENFRKHYYIKLLFGFLFGAVFLLAFFSGGNIFVKAEAVESNKYGFAGGRGSENDPFLIATAEQLGQVRNYSMNYDDALDVPMPGNHFRLIADIDLTAYLSEGGAGCNGGKGWEPIAVALSTFDGGGHTIRGLWIDRPDEQYVGLFGYAVNFIIKDTNIVLSEKGITGLGTAGGIAGYLTTYVWDKSSAVSGCSVTGNITSVREFAQNKPAESYAGLIIGRAFYAKIENCYAEGSVTGLSGIGGIAGAVEYADAADCFFKGSILTTAPTEWEVVCAGGIAGICYGDSVIKNCFYLSSSDTGNRVAGTAGFNGLISSSSGEAIPVSPPVIYSCYFNAGVLETVSFIALSGDAEELGEVITIENSKGLTAKEMKNKASYVGWDFEGRWGFDKDGNLVLMLFGDVYTPPDLVWLWITLAAFLSGAAAVTGGVILYRSKKTEFVTVTNTVEVEKEVIREVPVLKGEQLPADLSPKERQVAELILLGKPNREIARELEISEGTLKSHISRIFMKDGVDSQKEFIIRHLAKGE